ncbi:hypothetical protein EMIT048CA2_140153 [Pseudomonas chlororaphis]
MEQAAQVKPGTCALAVVVMKHLSQQPLELINPLIPSAKVDL